jgi:carbonic anhydrase
MSESQTGQVLEGLKRGNGRFLARVAANDPPLAKLASAQAPPAIVLGCADSRVAPEIAFDTGLGELFVVRVAGNVANKASVASIEYAVAHLGTRLIVVLAHENCGAVAAAIQGGDAGSNLNHLLEHIAPAVEAGEGRDADSVARLNARLNAERLTAESEILSKAVKEDGLEIIPAFFHLRTGEVEFG